MIRHCSVPCENSLSPAGNFPRRKSPRPGQMLKSDEQLRLQFLQRRNLKIWIADSGGLGASQQSAGHLTCHEGVALQKLVERVVVLQILEQRVDRHARALEHGRAAKDVQIHGDKVRCVHAGRLMLAVGMG